MLRKVSTFCSLFTIDVANNIAAHTEYKLLCFAACHCQ